jgi:hypothetical protein
MKMKNITFKKNDVEKLFLNLDTNPYSQKNKDFRYSLSLIYELVEEEFADTFDNKNQILRNTQIHFIKNEKEPEIFISPPYSFDYYLKTKGSLYKLKNQYLENKLGYKISLNMFFEYFTGVDENASLEDLSENYIFYLNLVQFVKKQSKN